MPQYANLMAVVSSSSGITLSTVDVYELASSIGSQFEKMIDCHGPESVTGLMPMVIRVLEHLEEMTKQNENEQAELIDLRFTVERLQAEKKLKAAERLKFEKELEQIEEMWKNEAKRQRDTIARLEEEKHRLSQSLREKLSDAKLRDEEEDRLQDLQAQVLSLQDTINKQKDEIRSLERELISKSTDIEMAHVEHLTRANDDYRRRSSFAQRQAQQLVEDKADLQASLHDKDQEVTRVRNQLKRLSSLCDPTVLGSLAPDVSDTDVNTPKFSASEMKNATSERDELQQKVNSAVEVLEQYQPETSKVDQGKQQVNEEELEPPVQGPINQEPEEKLYPERHVNKESNIRKLFKRFLDRLEKLKFSDDDDDDDNDNRDDSSDSDA